MENLVKLLDEDFMNSLNACESFIGQAVVACRERKEDQLLGVVNGASTDNGAQSRIHKRLRMVNRAYLAMREIAYMRDPSKFLDAHDVKEAMRESEVIKKTAENKAKSASDTPAKKKLVSKKNPGVNLPE